MKRYTKMYENKYKNVENSSTRELTNFLQLIADLDIEIELFAIGGTAMILVNIKESTKDIDFEKLKERYYSIAETSLITDFDLKFKHLEGKYDKR